MQVRKQQLEQDMESWTGSKLGKESIKVVYCQSAYLTYAEYIKAVYCHPANKQGDNKLAG